jgi:hypothetical protein
MMGPCRHAPQSDAFYCDVCRPTGRADGDLREGVTAPTIPPNSGTLALAEGILRGTASRTDDPILNREILKVANFLRETRLRRQEA